MAKSPRPLWFGPAANGQEPSAALVWSRSGSRRAGGAPRVQQVEVVCEHREEQLLRRVAGGAQRGVGEAWLRRVRHHLGARRGKVGDADVGWVRVRVNVRVRGSGWGQGQAQGWGSGSGSGSGLGDGGVDGDGGGDREGDGGGGGGGGGGGVAVVVAVWRFNDSIVAVRTCSSAATMYARPCEPYAREALAIEPSHITRWCSR
eukprot:938264-Prymnesium_polylepis.2